MWAGLAEDQPADGRANDPALCIGLNPSGAVTLGACGMRRLASAPKVRFSPTSNRTWRIGALAGPRRRSIPIKDEIKVRS